MTKYTNKQKVYFATTWTLTNILGIELAYHLSVSTIQSLHGFVGLPLWLATIGLPYLLALSLGFIIVGLMKAFIKNNRKFMAQLTPWEKAQVKEHGLLKFLLNH